MRIALIGICMVALSKIHAIQEPNMMDVLQHIEEISKEEARQTLKEASKLSSGYKNTVMEKQSQKMNMQANQIWHNIFQEYRPIWGYCWVCPCGRYQVRNETGKISKQPKR